MHRLFGHLSPGAGEINTQRRNHLILVDGATGNRITNLVCLQISRELANLIFQPVSGPGDYYLYFMPYTGTVKAPYPQINYLEPQETASPDWLESSGLASTGSGQSDQQPASSGRAAGDPIY